MELAVVAVCLAAVASAGWWWMDSQRREAEGVAVQVAASSLQRQILTSSGEGSASRWGTSEKAASAWLRGEANRMGSASVAHIGSAVRRHETSPDAVGTSGAADAVLTDDRVEWISVFAPRRTSGSPTARWCLTSSSLAAPKCAVPQGLALAPAGGAAPQVNWGAGGESAGRAGGATGTTGTEGDASQTGVAGPWPSVTLSPAVLSQWDASLRPPGSPATEKGTLFARPVDAAGLVRTDLTATVSTTATGAQVITVTPSATGTASGSTTTGSAANSPNTGTGASGSGSSTGLTAENVRDLVEDGDVRLELVLANSDGGLGRSYLDLTPAVDPFAVELDGPMDLNLGTSGSWSISGVDASTVIIVWEVGLNGGPVECLTGAAGPTCTLTPSTTGQLQIQARLTREGFGSVTLSRVIDVRPGTAEVDLPPTATLVVTPDTVVRGSGTVRLDATGSQDDRTPFAQLAFGWDLPGIALSPLTSTVDFAVPQTDVAADTLQTVSVVVLDGRWQATRRSVTIRRRDLRTALAITSGNNQSVRLLQSTRDSIVVTATGFFGQPLAGLKLLVSGPGPVLPRDTLTADALGRIQFRVTAPATGTDSLLFTVQALDRTATEAPPAVVVVRVASGIAGLDSVGILTPVDTVVRLRTLALATRIAQPTVTPAAPTPLGALWTSSNPSIATVDSLGVVRGVSVGTTTIQLSVSTPAAPGFTASTRTATRTIRVTPAVPALRSITITGTDSVIALRTQLYGVSPVFAPELPGPIPEGAVRWLVNPTDTAFAAVDPVTGVVTGKAPGTARLFARMDGPQIAGYDTVGQTASRTIRITPAIPALTSITILGPDSVRALRTGAFQDSVVLHAGVPGETGDGTARWSLDPADTTFARVDSITGVLTGRQPGTVRLRLTVTAPVVPTFDLRPLSVSRLVTITPGEPGITALTGSPRAVRLAVGDTLMASALPLALSQPGGAPVPMMTYVLADSTTVRLRRDAGPLRLIGSAVGATTLRVIASTPELGGFLAAADTVVLTIQTGLAGEPQDLVLLSGGGQSGVRGQPLGQLVRFELRDARSRPVPGMALDARLTPTTGGVTPTTLVTDAAGQVAVTWRLDTLAGAQSLQLRVATDTVIWRTTSATALYGPAATVTQLGAWAPTGPLRMNETPSGPTVSVRDAFNQAVRGTTTPLRVALLPPGVRPTQWAAVRDSVNLVGTAADLQTIDTTGTGTLVLRPLRGTAGWWRIGVAMAPGGTVPTGAALVMLPDSILVGPGAVARLVATRGDTLSPVSGRPGAPVAVADRPQARAEDAYGNALAGLALQFVRSPGADLTMVTTDASGLAEFPALAMPLPPRSADTLTLSVPGQAGTGIDALRWAFEGRDPVYELVNPVGSPLIVRGTAFDVAIRAMDAETWTPIIGLQLRYRPRVGDGTVPGDGVAATDSNGVATIPWTVANRLAIQQLGVEDVEQPLGGTKVEVRVETIEAAAGALAWDRAPSGTYRMGDAATPAIRVAVRNRSGETGTPVPVAGRPVQLRVITTGGDSAGFPIAVSPDVVLTDTLGIADFSGLSFRGRLDTAATVLYTLEATTPGVAAALTSPVTLAPGRGHHLVGIRGMTQTTPAPGTPLDSVIVSVRDAWGNPVSGDSVRFATRNTGGFVLRSLVRNTNDLGLADPQLWMAGSLFEPQVLVAQLPGSGGTIRDSLRVVTGIGPVAIRLLRNGTPWLEADTVPTNPNGWVTGAWAVRVRTLSDTPVAGVPIELRLDDPTGDIILGSDTTVVAPAPTGVLRGVSDSNGLVTFSWRVRTPLSRLQRLVARVREVPSTGPAQARVRVNGAVNVTALREVVTGRLTQRRGDLRDRAVFLQVDALGRPVRRAGELYLVEELDETWLPTVRGTATSDSLGQVVVEAPAAYWALDRLGTSRLSVTRATDNIAVVGAMVTVVPGLPDALEVPGTLATWRDALRPYLLVGATHPAIPLVVRSIDGDSVPGATLRWRPSGRLQWEAVTADTLGIVTLPAWTALPHWSRAAAPGAPLRPWLRLEVELQPQGMGGGPFPVIVRDSVQLSIPAALDLTIDSTTITPAASGYYFGGDPTGLNPLRLTAQLGVAGYFGEGIEGITMRLTAAPAGSQVPTVVTSDAAGSTAPFTWEIPRILSPGVAAELRVELGPDALADMPLARLQTFRLLTAPAVAGSYALDLSETDTSACLTTPTAWCATHEPVGGSVVFGADDAWQMTLQLRNRSMPSDTSTVTFGGTGPGQWANLSSELTVATAATQPATSLLLFLDTPAVAPQVTSTLTILHSGGGLRFMTAPVPNSLDRPVAVELGGHLLFFMGQP